MACHGYMYWIVILSFSQINFVYLSHQILFGDGIPGPTIETLLALKNPDNGRQSRVKRGLPDFWVPLSDDFERHEDPKTSGYDATILECSWDPGKGCKVEKEAGDYKTGEESEGISHLLSKATSLWTHE